MRNEINNPLNGIMGLAEVIAGKAIPPGKARELAAMIKTDAFRLDYQIQNVFCAAELEAGDVEPNINRVDVGSIIRDVADSFEPLALAKGVDLTCHVSGELMGFPTDGEKLHHILANLVAHAVEFSLHSGNVEILVEAGDDQLDLHVVDHGVGLPERLRTAMFAPFGIDLDQAGIPHGHDLGLPVVKALADLLGGDIRVLSAPGAGTAFHLRLPRAQAEEGQAEALDGNLIIFDGPPQAF
jgi:signal transduction histidine kinase